MAVRKPASALPLHDPYFTDESERQRRNALFVAMLHEWLNDESGLDEPTWPEVRAALNRERAATGEEPLFDD